MTDIKSEEERSKNMSAIKSADTKPELFIRKLLFSSGYRYRIQVSNIPGRPDLWLRKYNTAIFVHGCFWHRHKGCRFAYLPKSRVDFWNEKFDKNIHRDQQVLKQLKVHKIKCLVIWECTIKRSQRKNGDPLMLLNEIVDFLHSDEEYMEL